MDNRKRMTEETIVLMLSGACSLCILPFLLIRAHDADWLIASLDLFIISISTALFVYVYCTHRVQFSSPIIASLCALLLVTTIVIKGSEQIIWLYPVSVGIFYLLSPLAAVVINLIVALSIGALLWEQLDAFTLAQYAFSLLITFTFSYAFAEHMLRQQEKLLKLSNQDPLTGAGNRRAIDEKLLKTAELRRSNKATSAALILIDLDKFKKINDQYGHVIGDKILVHFVQVIHQRLRQTDKIYRIGGEEFVVIAENINAESASNLAEKLREAIDKTTFPSQLHVTISLGVAQYKTGESDFEWMDRADKAMYQAKKSGRNVCCIAA